MAGQVEAKPVVFTYGEDTSTCGGSISTDFTKVTFSSVPLTAESDTTITQLVNVTNRDSSSHSVRVFVTHEDFGSELSSLGLYFVSPSGTETLVVELDDSGDVVKDDVLVRIPQREEWSIKLVGHYDSGTLSSQKNEMVVIFQVKAKS
ncbi:MAG: hypothetical protein ACETWE_12210 [Candidatus Bathyarchaeia archaeon]